MSSTAEEPTDKSALIGKVVRSLADDYHRRGGFLSAITSFRAVEKRGLEPEDDVLIRQQLETLESTSMIRKRLDSSNSMKLIARSEDIVRRYSWR